MLQSNIGEMRGITMMRISSKQNKYTYNAYHIVKSFFPGEEIIQKVEEKQEPLMAVRRREALAFPLHAKRWMQCLKDRSSSPKRRESRL